MCCGIGAETEFNMFIAIWSAEKQKRVRRPERS